MHAIMETEYSISNIHQVVHNSMVKGRILNNRKGRYSQCFVYVLQGETRYTFHDGRSFTVHPREVLYLAKDSLYVMDILTDTYEVLFVDFDYITDKRFQSDIFTMPKAENIEFLFQKLHRKWMLRGNAYRSECFSVLYDLYSAMIQYFSQPYLPSVARSQIAPAVNHLIANYTNPDLKITDLAEMSGLSEGHFRRLFKNVYAVSPAQYIRNLRIKYAQHLLQYGNQSIASIAELSGFQNAFYFCKIFKEETEYTPTEYRRNFSGN